MKIVYTWKQVRGLGTPESLCSWWSRWSLACAVLTLNSGQSQSLKQMSTHMDTSSVPDIWPTNHLLSPILHAHSWQFSLIYNEWKFSAWSSIGTIPKIQGTAKGWGLGVDVLLRHRRSLWHSSSLESWLLLLRTQGLRFETKNAHRRFGHENHLGECSHPGHQGGVRRYSGPHSHTYTNTD